MRRYRFTQSFKKKLVRIILKWARHVERMGDEKLAKRADAQKVEGNMRRGRLIMGWEDCIKGDQERVGGEWRTTAKDGRARDLIHNIVRKSEERKEKTKENMTVTMASLTSDDRDNKRRTTSDFINYPHHKYFTVLVYIMFTNLH